MRKLVARIKLQRLFESLDRFSNVTPVVIIGPFENKGVHIGRPGIGSARQAHVKQP